MPNSRTETKRCAPLPLFVEMTGKKALIAGGGCVAQRKAALLIEHGCMPVIVSPACTDRIREYAQAGKVELHSREFRAEDAQGCFLVFACTDSREVNESVCAAARVAGALANCTDTDTPEVSIPSSITRGELQVAISTGGSSPALAKVLRIELEERFGESWADYLALLRQVRALIMERVDDPKLRHSMNRLVLAAPFLERIEAGETVDTEEAFAFALKEANNTEEA